MDCWLIKDTFIRIALYIYIYVCMYVWIQVLNKLHIDKDSLSSKWNNWIKRNNCNIVDTSDYLDNQRQNLLPHETYVDKTTFLLLSITIHLVLCCWTQNRVQSQLHMGYLILFCMLVYNLKVHWHVVCVEYVSQGLCHGNFQLYALFPFWDGIHVQLHHIRYRQKVLYNLSKIFEEYWIIHLSAPQSYHS
jgi:hypothetical protein